MRISYYVLFAICAAVLGAVLRAAKSSTAQLLSVGACVLLALKLFADHAGVISSANMLFDSNGFAQYGTTLIKALGVGMLCQISGDVCRDLGEGSVASALELAGKMEIVALALPLATELINTARTLVL